MRDTSFPRGLGRWFNSWLAVGAALLATQAIVALTLRHGSALVAYYDISYLVLLLLASGVAFRNAVRSRQAARLFWAFLAAAFGVWALVSIGWLNRGVFHDRIPSFVHYFCTSS
jgi:hypothetical protein